MVTHGVIVRDPDTIRVEHGLLGWSVYAILELMHPYGGLECVDILHITRSFLPCAVAQYAQICMSHNVGHIVEEKS